VARIALGLQSCFFLGNLEARRDWGHARDYVEAQWLMLQQEQPEDFVIATGKQYSVREMVETAAEELGIRLRWEGQGVEEVGIVGAVDAARVGGKSVLQQGDTVVRIDPRYFRPAEVDTLLGDPRKAKQKLGWEARISFKEMVEEMVRTDLEIARRDELVRQSGFQVYDYNE